MLWLISKCTIYALPQSCLWMHVHIVVFDWLIFLQLPALPVQLLISVQQMHTCIFISQPLWFPQEQHMLRDNRIRTCWFPVFTSSYFNCLPFRQNNLLPLGFCLLWSLVLISRNSINVCWFSFTTKLLVNELTIWKEISWRISEKENLF